MQNFTIHECREEIWITKHPICITQHSKLFDDDRTCTENCAQSTEISWYNFPNCPLNVNVRRYDNHGGEDKCKT